MSRFENLRKEQTRYLPYVLFFIAAIVVTFSISSQSLWIDEGITVWFASQPSFEEVLNAITNTSHAESLMPGHIIYMWTWIKLFGLSEYNLRLSNAPLIIFALFLFAKLPLREVFKIGVILITCLSPFLWFYMNEVRSYIALFSFSAVGISGLVYYFRGTPRWRRIGPYLTVTSFFFGSFFNISFGFTMPALIVTGLFLYNETHGDRQRLIRDWTKPVLYSIPFFLLLGGYYLWMIIENSGGGRLQAQHTAPDLRHVVLVFYEFFGFMGLGPPRNILRTNSSLDVFTPYLIWVVPFCLLLIGIGVSAVFLPQKLLNNKGWFFKGPYLCSFVIGFFFFCGFAFFVNFVFYGRHVIFLYPYFIFAIAFVISELWRTRSNFDFRIMIIVALLLMCLVSDIRLRFHPEYSKDNYRLAVKTAISISKDDAPIYWAADFHTGAYYGLIYSNIDPSKLHIPPAWRRIHKAYYASNWADNVITRETKDFESAVLVLSKLDLFDVRAGWRSFIKEHKPAEIREFGVFQIYRFNFHQD